MILLNRQYHIEGVRKYPHGKKMIDMGIIRKYLMLPTPTQTDVARTLQIEPEELNRIVTRIEKVIYELI